MARHANYDVIILGAGHNALTAGALLARAGMRTLLLERLDRVGGAAVSARAFPGRPVQLSRYSYLVSLMPEELMAELELDVELRSRSVSSYTPYLHPDGRPDGLLVEHEAGPATAESFRRLTGGDDEYASWQRFYADVAELAAVLAPTLLRPLPRRADIATQVPLQIWGDLITQPIGVTIRDRFTHDLVRGVVATDALIGTFADLNSSSLIPNRCFLYHLIGNATGEWRVPVGGMGAVTGALHRAAVTAGAELETGARVERVLPGPDEVEVQWQSDGVRHSARAPYVLSGVAPWTLAGLLDEPAPPRPEGAQLKINFLLDRLPRLRADVDPDTAFAGTLHLAEQFSGLQQAYSEASRGVLPTHLPGEVYCHSLTDPSILNGDPGHTLTYFGLHTPATLLDVDGAKEEAVARAIAVLDSHLAQPLLSCVARDENGALCIEAKTPSEIESDLAMPGGHIFHGDLAWPWADDTDPLDTPADRWGVATAHPRILVCGSGARRGGAVSGLGGHNAARAVLAETAGH
ncbi:phytoene desaturase family protein [Nocardioides sp. Bht2]|uniref:phytoene desaturase family protein n=1 Tax=Nocardioides sp. Bht2 TaxID=3392297 RepID=UPI0039B3FD0A